DAAGVELGAAALGEEEVVRPRRAATGDAVGISREEGEGERLFVVVEGARGRGARAQGADELITDAGDGAGADGVELGVAERARVEAVGFGALEALELLEDIGDADLHGVARAATTAEASALGQAQIALAEEGGDEAAARRGVARFG